MAEITKQQIAEAIRPGIEKLLRKNAFNDTAAVAVAEYAASLLYDCAGSSGKSLVELVGKAAEAKQRSYSSGQPKAS